VNGETKTVMKGITHGACDYLLKPVRLEELRNIWQHVVRRKFSNRERANVDGYEECNRLSNADFDNVHGQTCGSPDQSGRPSKKRKEYHSERKMKARRVIAKKMMILQVQRSQGLFGQLNYIENLLLLLTSWELTVSTTATWHLLFFSQLCCC